MAFYDDDNHPVLNFLFTPIRDVFDRYSSAFERTPGITVLSLAAIACVTLGMVG